MTQLLAPTPLKRSTSPLHADRMLHAVLELARETTCALADNPRDFECGLQKLEGVVARFRSAFLAQPHHAADVALAYHDRATAEMNEEFTPLYYRRAVLENVAQRYERTAQELLLAYA